MNPACEAFAIHLSSFASFKSKEMYSPKENQFVEAPVINPGPGSDDISFCF